MDNYTHILDNLTLRLQIMEAANEDPMEGHSKSISQCKLALENLYRLKTRIGELSVEHEIEFFKNKKAVVLGKLLYHVKMYNLELKKPHTSSKALIQYYKKATTKLYQYIEENMEFYRYYRSGNTDLDHKYFTHKHTDLKLYPESALYYSDSEFSTSHDAMLATIIANENVIFQLRSEIENIKNLRNNHAGQEAKMLQWKANKNDLVELIYALQASGAIGPSHVSLKKITDGFCQLFNIELGNISRTYLELMDRSQQTKFMDNLRENLQLKMQKTDEKNRN